VKEQGNINNFHDLPSEDSCLEDSSESEDENGANYEDEESELNTPLAERISSKRTNGIASKAKTRSINKKAALALAQKRLSEMKRKRKTSDDVSPDSDSDDDSESDGNSDSDSQHEKETLQSQKKRKKNKHMPTLASSSRSEFYRRGAPDLNCSGISVEIGANKYKPRDPRMQSLSGHFDQNVFERRFEFLEKVQEDEIERLKKRCNAWKMTGKRGNKMRKKLGLTSANTADEDEAELKRLLQERASRMDAKIRNAAKSTVKKKLRDDVAAGKRGVYYLKRRDMKRLELEAKFDQLRKMGGDAAVNKAIAKRRKKKMGKDSGLMPNVDG
jgi:ribosomal RNA-processing protein 36